MEPSVKVDILLCFENGQNEIEMYEMLNSRRTYIQQVQPEASISDSPKRKRTGHSDVHVH